MKKIAIVNHNLGSGGAEKLIYDMAIELKKRGVNFSVILLTSVNCIYGKKLIEQGIEVIYLSSKWDIYSPKNIVRLVKVLREYDVIHAHIYSVQLWTAIASLFLGKDKIYLTTEHSTNNNRRGKGLFKFLDRWMYSKYNKLVSINEETESALKNWIGNSYSYEIIKNGVDIESILQAPKILREELGYDQEDILICQVARLNIVKNQECSIRAMRYLPDNYKLLLVGEGEKREDLELLVKDLDLEDRVKFLGYRTDVPSILKMSNVSILTSKYEGLSISCLESMLLLPFIGSNVPGIRDVVKGAGLLFEDENSKELSEKIKELIIDKEEYENIEARCFERAKEYDIRKTVDKYLKIYQGGKR